LIALVLALSVGYGIRAARSEGPTPGRTSTTAYQGPAVAPLSSLPRQAAQTVELIMNGGPYPYPRNDGAVFHNNERLLPREPDGYYREYTVLTPGSAQRGGRRIITGQDGAIYYTPDHYDSFVKVDTTR